MKPALNTTAQLFIVAFLLLFAISCHSIANKQDKTSTPVQSRKLLTEKTNDSNAAIVNEDDTKYFKVEKVVTNGIYMQSYVYLSDKSKLQNVNKYLVLSYKGKWTQVLDIWYFDKQGIVNKYLSVLDDESKSDDEFNKLDKHFICQYEQLAGEDGDFDYNK